MSLSRQGSYSTRVTLCLSVAHFGHFIMLLSFCSSRTLNTSLRSELTSEAIHSGIGPHSFSIIAKCSTSSWVGNRREPVYISIKMHPTDQTSDLSSHEQHCMVTSGPLYYLVLTITFLSSSSSDKLEAPPKSITTILKFEG